MNHISELAWPADALSGALDKVDRMFPDKNGD